MIRFAVGFVALTALAPGAALAVQAEPAAAPAAAPVPPAPPAAAPAPAAAPVDLSNDPRMIAAIRHANARADAKCGAGAGLGVVDLQTKMAARTCRRRMVDAAKLEAETDITGH